MTNSIFLEYDSFNLRALLRFKIKELMKKHIGFREAWIKNKRCICVENLREGITINCKHYNFAVKKYLEEDEKKIKKLGLLVIKTDLYNNLQFPNDWLHSG